MSPFTMSFIGRFCSSLFGISVTIVASIIVCPVAAKAVFTASKYASFESTMVPSKSRSMALTFSFVFFMSPHLTMLWYCCFLKPLFGFKVMVISA